MEERKLVMACDRPALRKSNDNGRAKVGTVGLAVPHFFRCERLILSSVRALAYRGVGHTDRSRISRSHTCISRVELNSAGMTLNGCAGKQNMRISGNGLLVTKTVFFGLKATFWAEIWTPDRCDLMDLTNPTQNVQDPLLGHWAHH